MFYNPGEILIINPRLAAKLGLNEAIILQQLHYWLEMPGVGEIDTDGHKWVYNTYDQWHENFPFFSVMTIKRTFLKLEKDSIIVAKHKARCGRRTKYYRINYEALRRLEIEEANPGTPETSYQNDIQSDALTSSYQFETQSLCQIDTLASYQSDTFLINKDYESKDYGLTETTKARYRAREPGGVDFCERPAVQESEDFREKRAKRSDARKGAAANCAVLEEVPQEEVSAGDFRWLKKQYHELARAFLEFAGDVYYPRTASERKLWYKTLHEWYLIDARREDVREAVLKLRKDGLTIGGIQSITKTLRAVKASAHYDPLELLGYQRL